MATPVSQGPKSLLGKDIAAQDPSPAPSRQKLARDKVRTRGGPVLSFLICEMGTRAHGLGIAVRIKGLPTKMTHRDGGSGPRWPHLRNGDNNTVCPGGGGRAR